MNRLQSELRRLYLVTSQAVGKIDAQSVALIDPPATVRGLVMELTRPPCWEVLARVWYGVQTELELPAPAIAISGIDGLQLWFSVDEPIPVAQAQAFLEGLRVQFLPDIKRDRLRLLPAANSSASRAQDRAQPHAPPVPALQEHSGNWSAFVAPDLAPVFADTPWLDVPPNEDGQAALLRGLEPMKLAVFEAALANFGFSAQPASPSPTPHSTALSAALVADPFACERPVTSPRADDPKRFLLQVMNDVAVPLAQRIEAARVLLQHSDERRKLPGD